MRPQGPTFNASACPAELFEQFLANKFPSSKRFGLEGCDALIPALHAFVRTTAGHGTERIEVSMAHRGRLNVLHNVLDKPLGALCSEMEGRQSAFRVGDVKYHLGQSVRCGAALCLIRSCASCCIVCDGD